MIVTIHQPAFLPWMPFFKKIEKADVFVMLTHCQFQKNNYQNRFFYQEKWHTMSVNRGLEPITDKKYVSFEKDWNKIKTNIPDKKRFLSRFDKYIGENLAQTNVSIIEDLIDALEIKTKVVYDEPTSLTSTDRLVWLCKKHGAKTYLSGESGKNYLEIKKFYDAGINVEFQDNELFDKKHVLDLF